MATSGHRRSVDSTMICETSHGSSWLLSVNTRAPSCPASSLARANSCNSRTHLADCACAETGELEKIFKPRSDAGISMNAWLVMSMERSIYASEIADHDRQEPRA